MLVRLEPVPGDPDAPATCVADVDCDDGVACTSDACGADGACAHEPDDGACLESERCDPAAGCVVRRACESDAECRDADPCNGVETCGPEGFCSSGSPLECDDGVFCNGDEICRTGRGCEPGTARTCSDGIDCSEDRCDEESRQCVSSPDDSRCDDLEYCNGAEACVPGQGCAPGASPCDDGVDCSEDQCVEDLDECLHHGAHERCAPGELCWRDEDGFECVRVDCDPDADSECDDLDDCNGVETCAEDGHCQPGLGLPCDDGVFCNGAEFCDVWCRSQEPPSCFDGVDCTSDLCDPDLDSCVHQGVDLWCDDGLFCTDDSCSEAGCERFDAICDDSIACTIDLCSEERGGCTQDPPDLDRDGYGGEGCGGDDCDDSDQAVHPGAPELCNAMDEDCNLVPDDGLECRYGDGRPCDTPCLSLGWQSCNKPACTWGDCEPPPEDCNGVDDDCDTAVDEDCDCIPGDPDERCKTPCGSWGTRSCGNDGRWSACVPPDETCNGEDDDCDGTDDEDFQCEQGAVLDCDFGCDLTGTQTCGVDCVLGDCVGPDETCNGLDDDCDGEADEDFACVQGTAEACATICGGGESGTRVCSQSCAWGPCVAPDETCNGEDDDCNGLCDDGFTCCASQPFGSCVTECNSIGSGWCDVSCEETADRCDVGDEVCNGRDDDCDDEPDDGFACAAWIETRTCSLGNGVMQGRQRCYTDCEWGECCAASDRCDNGADDDCDGGVDEADCCEPPAFQILDLCDGQDDDCDGLCDENGGDCCLDEWGSCLTDCNTVGSRTCVVDPQRFPPSCVWDVCQPPPENCGNGIDDDCNGLIDHDDWLCAVDPL
ncbi:MAG: hypothetical protein HYY06_03150 [Deltaproteobacteria bacterium]|nr:hypothetical protein [Deltaproteobacteria bacterium]